MKYILILSVLVFSLVATANKQKEKSHYGEKITAKNPISLDEAVAKLGKSKSQKVLVAAKVEKVCKKSGCWMGLKNKSGDLRVTFKDYGFFVPLSLIGKKVLIEGDINKKKMSLKETKHYVEDAGGDPSKVTEGRTEYRIVASGVRVVK